MNARQRNTGSNRRQSKTEETRSQQHHHRESSHTQRNHRHSSQTYNSIQEHVVDNERAEQLLQQQKQAPPLMSVAWGYGRFGIRWSTSIDMMNVPDTAGVFVLFFAQKRKIVGAADNLFRTIQQYWYAPGPPVVAFSWLEIIPPENNVDAQRSLQSRSYEQLWEDLRSPAHESQETD